MCIACSGAVGERRRGEFRAKSGDEAVRRLRRRFVKAKREFSRGAEEDMGEIQRHEQAARENEA